MKKLVLICLFPLLLAGCCDIELRAVEDVRKSQEIVVREYAVYVANDQTLDADHKKERADLVKTLRELTETLRKSAGGK